MTRSARWLIAALTVVVTAGFGEIHAHLIGHYPFAEMPRFAWLVVFGALILLTTYAVGLPEEAVSFTSAFYRSTIALASSWGLVSLFALVAGSPLLPRFVVFASGVTLAPLLAASSLISRQSRQRREQAARVLAIVTAEEAAALERELRRAPERPATLAGTFIPVPETADPGDGDDPGTLASAVERCRATMIVLDRAAQVNEALVREVADLHRHGVRGRTLSLFYDEWLGKFPINELERAGLLFDINELHRASYARLKRALDVLASLAGIGLLAIVIPLVFVADRIGNKGPLFFRQARVGRDGAVFSILKFRTMREGHPGSTWTEVDDSRITRVGRLLRRSHLDELPQFVNVLRKDLSVVGPRPEQPQYVEQLVRKVPFYDIRHIVRPGITGWAQVKYDYGASDLDAIEKLQYEFYYLRHQGLILDLRIMGRTLRAIVGRRGR